MLTIKCPPRPSTGGDSTSGGGGRSGSVCYSRGPEGMMQTRLLDDGPLETVAQTLDVVVLGGGGHVGLPLSLALADSGLHVGVFDINDAALAEIASGRMPFMENGAEDLLHGVLATGRLTLSSAAS